MKYEGEDAEDDPFSMYKSLVNYEACHTVITHTTGLFTSLLTWAPKEIQSTVFDFGRWAWVALIGHGLRLRRQVNILCDAVAQSHYEADVAELNVAMLQHSPASGLAGSASSSGKKWQRSIKKTRSTGSICFAETSMARTHRGSR